MTMQLDIKRCRFARAGEPFNLAVPSALHTKQGYQAERSHDLKSSYAGRKRPHRLDYPKERNRTGPRPPRAGARTLIGIVLTGER